LLPAGDFDQPAVEVHLIEDGAKKGRFARAVIAHKADAAFGMNRPGNLVEQVSIQKRQTDVAEINQPQHSVFKAAGL